MSDFVRSGLFETQYFDFVRVTVRTNARNVTGRWKNGVFSVSTPPWVTVDQLKQILDKWALSDDSPLKSKEVSIYEFDKVYEFDYFSIRIIENRNDADLQYRLLQRNENMFTIVVPKNENLNERLVADVISRCFKSLAKKFGQKLINEAREEYRRLGVKPRDVTIGMGINRLGTCNARGEISLSCCLLFMPRDLRRYIICHEAAHLSEFDHSQRFHDLLDSYLDGHEAELWEQVRNFKLPVI